MAKITNKKKPDQKQKVQITFTYEIDTTLEALLPDIDLTKKYTDKEIVSMIEADIAKPDSHYANARELIYEVIGDETPWTMDLKTNYSNTRSKTPDLDVTHPGGMKARTYEPKRCPTCGDCWSGANGGSCINVPA